MAELLLMAVVILLFIFLSKTYRKNAEREEKNKTLLFELTNQKDFGSYFVDVMHHIRFSSEINISPGVVYYHYIGSGKFIKKMKYVPDGNSTLEKISSAAEQRISDYSNSCGDFSSIFTSKDVIGLVYRQRMS